MNLYTAQFIHDVDNDGVMDILQTHGGDPFSYVFLSYEKCYQICINLLILNLQIISKIFYYQWLK